MRALRVLLATMVAVPLFAYSASEMVIAWVLRDSDRPAAPRGVPTFAHRGLACVNPSSARAVARQTHVSSSRTLTQSMERLLLSEWLSRRYDRDELIRLQGDTVYLGRRARGLEAGAQAWFGRPLSEITTAQSALLVAFEQYPSGVDPTKNRVRALKRRQWVLGAWQTCGLISPGSAISLESSSVLDGILPSPRGGEDIDPLIHFGPRTSRTTSRE